MEKMKEEFGAISLCEQLQSVPLPRLQAVFGEKPGQQVVSCLEIPTVVP